MVFVITVFMYTFQNILDLLFAMDYYEILKYFYMITFKSAIHF